MSSLRRVVVHEATYRKSSNDVQGKIENIACDILRQPMALQRFAPVGFHCESRSTYHPADRAGESRIGLPECQRKCDGEALTKEELRRIGDDGVDDLRNTAPAHGELGALLTSLQ